MSYNIGILGTCLRSISSFQNRELCEGLSSKDLIKLLANMGRRHENVSFLSSSALSYDHVT